MQPERTESRYPMPFTRLEIALLGVVEGRLQVLLARREQAPYAGRWALPGGVLRIDLDRTLDDAARRVMHERLGLSLPFLRQLCAIGGPTRDPRAPWALSLVYRALVRSEQLQPLAGKRIAGLTWRLVEDAIEDRSLAFDHAGLIAQAAKATREEINRLELPAGLLSNAFTLAELQSTCEQVLGRKLDKSSFRRRIADQRLVVPIEGAMKRGANRPAQVYALAED